MCRTLHAPQQSTRDVFKVWKKITRSVYSQFIFSRLSPQQGLGCDSFICQQKADILEHRSWGKGGKYLKLSVCRSFSKDSIIFSPCLCGHVLYCYQHFLYWFYQCYKACHIPTPTQDSHNHLVIVSPTVIWIQNESVFCSKPRAFLKSLHARKQSFMLCMQFHSYICKQTLRVHFVWNGPGWRVKQLVCEWMCLVLPPQAGQGMDTLPTQQMLSQGKFPVSKAITSGQGCWSRSHKLW